MKLNEITKKSKQIVRTSCKKLHVHSNNRVFRVATACQAGKTQSLCYVQNTSRQLYDQIPRILIHFLTALGDVAVFTFVRSVIFLAGLIGIISNPDEGPVRCKTLQKLIQTVVYLTQQNIFLQNVGQSNLCGWRLVEQLNNSLGDCTI